MPCRQCATGSGEMTTPLISFSYLHVTTPGTESTPPYLEFTVDTAHVRVGAKSTSTVNPASLPNLHLTVGPRSDKNLRIGSLYGFHVLSHAADHWQSETSPADATQAADLEGRGYLLGPFTHKSSSQRQACPGNT